MTVLLLVVLAAALGVWYFAFVDGERSRMVQAYLIGMRSSMAGIPAEVENASFLLWPRNGGALYTMPWLDYSWYKNDKLLSEHVRAGELQAVIARVRGSSEGAHEVIVGDRVVVESMTRLRGLSLAPDGRFVSFARHLPGTDAALSGSWEAVIVDLSTGDERVLGSGFAAPFVGAGAVARFSPEGIEVADAAGAPLSSFPETFASVVPVAAAADGSRLSFMREQSAVVLHVDAASAQLEQIASFRIPLPLSLEVGAEALYAVRMSPDGGTEVVRFGFDDGTEEVVVKFPPQLAIASMTL